MGLKALRKLNDLLESRILCETCIHRISPKFEKDYCRMDMVKNLKRKACKEYQGKTQMVDNYISKCFPMMFVEIYTKLHRDPKALEQFHSVYCKKCKNLTRKGWCKRFARRIDEILDEDVRTKG